ncbi:Hypothetical predicted protein [Lecanosticta acicola]|uniref:VOC domain-containing protein n=1 Tax=Lecanosticta acicola TaxID=111012 RepID=A0AAI8YWJ4_9PEZI|nr:Hypothetical predicted protein [Lecanosticta acicola]
MITGLHHVNLIVPAGTLAQAEEFYGETLGLTPRPVPELQKGSLAWYDLGSSGQQVHIAFGPAEANSSRHPCFRVASPEALLLLRQRVWEHHRAGGASAPQQADRPGEVDSGAQGKEYPQRFFARDYAGNRLEFTV